MHRLKATQSLSEDSVERYSRQLLLPEVSVDGMKALQSTRVLVVGAGGLGCPAAMYLATAGVGTIGIVEYDTVDKSNLHRQIGHREDSIGELKVESLIKTLKSLNSTITYESFPTVLRGDNAMEIAERFDVIVDASDNVPTRYLLSDLCVLLKKPLVSGSALRWEGQLTVYNYNSGPCYRCVFPKPPPVETVTNCSDGGVLGPVTGVIGSLQSLEVLKIALSRQDDVQSGRLLMFDGLSGSFRCLRLRKRDPKCIACGDQPTIKKLIDYELFCGSAACDKTLSLKILQPHDRISAQEFREHVIKEKANVIDVRPAVEFTLCHIPGSLNIPFDSLKADPEGTLRILNGENDHLLICRRGNDSQVAVEILKKNGMAAKDVIGGLESWRRLPDVSFPVY